MKGRSFTASILVLTEDGWPAPHRALVRRMLRLVDPAHDATRIDVEGDHPDAQQAATANLAKGRKGGGHQKRVALARAIATQIFTENGFVFFHVDADRTWSDKNRGPVENVQFFEQVLHVVTQHLRDLLASKQDPRDPTSLLARVCLLLPYYSIESWLLQNTQVGRELCQKHDRGRHVELFNRWEQDRGALDELPAPKEATCLHPRHYLDLASNAYPGQAVRDAGKSFAETVDRLEACPALQRALAATRAYSATPPQNP